MSLQRNYYEVLGIPTGATTDQIKKKYRELARKFHPDVVQDKALGQRVFTQINQAYSVLGDPERRALYNGTLTQSTAAPSRSSTAPSAAPAAAPQTAPAAAPQTAPAASARDAAAPRTAPAAAPKTAPAAAPKAATGQSPDTQKSQAIAGLLGRADSAIMAGKPIEARAFCVRVLEIDPRHVRAMELLGDALVQMGRTEEAAAQYRRALQIAPSTLIQAKLERAAQSAPSTRTNPPHQASPARSGSGGQKTTLPGAGSQLSDDAEKSGGLLGRLLGRK